MGRNLHHAVRREGGVPEFARLLQRRRRSGLTLAPVLLAVAIFATPQLTVAENIAPDSDYNAVAACRDLKGALQRLGEAEHEEAFALDLASEGGGTGSMAMVEARLSKLLERSQDLRMTLRRARLSRWARDPMTEQCTKTGFRALVTAEKLSSDVETVLFPGTESSATAGTEPLLNPGRIEQKPAPPATPHP